jgi:hypothetical protein
MIARSAGLLTGLLCHWIPRQLIIFRFAFGPLMARKPEGGHAVQTFFKTGPKSFIPIYLLIKKKETLD